MGDEVVYPQSEPGGPSPSLSPSAEAFDRQRREVLLRLGRAAGYAAPVTMAMVSLKASATSLTC